MLTTFKKVTEVMDRDDPIPIIKQYIQVVWSLPDAFYQVIHSLNKPYLLLAPRTSPYLFRSSIRDLEC